MLTSQWNSVQLLGNSPDKLRHTRSVAYWAELVLLNKHQISGGGAYLDCYQMLNCKVNQEVENNIDWCDVGSGMVNTVLQVCPADEL